MKITTVIDWDTPFVYSTIGWAITGLTDYLKNTIVKVYDYNELKQRKIEADSECDFFIFEIGNPQHAGWTTKQLREKFPNAKFIALCSDTVYYMVNNLQPQMDVDGIDLHLEMMPQPAEWLQSKGAKTKRWFWTLSDLLLDQANYFHYRNGFNREKKYDFIGVYHPGSISNPDCWRHHAINFIKNHDYTFTQGGGNGHGDDDFERLFRAYLDSFCTLGTTSHNRKELTRLGCMKGFRDWLGPPLGAILIYDNHPNIDLFGVEIPRYDYDDFQSMIQLLNELKNNRQLTEDILLKQMWWTKENTIDRQLVKIMLEENWIKQEQIYEPF